MNPVKKTLKSKNQLRSQDTALLRCNHEEL